MSFQRKAIVLSIDGLGARALGAYGNIWYENAHFDQLAAGGLLFEQLYATDPQSIATLGGACDALLDQPECEWILLTDDRNVCDAFRDRVTTATLLQPQSSAEPVAEWTETELAGFFSAALEAVEELQPGQLLLLHTGALTRCWDAPLEYRAALRGEEDPEPNQSTEPPSMRRQSDADPDELLAWQINYGAQVQVLDQCLNVLLDLIEDLPAEERPLLVVTAPRGYPLGEHRVVGFAEPLLYDELLQVPGLIWMPDSQLAAVRVPELMQVAELFRLAAAYVQSDVKEFSRFVADPFPVVEQPVISRAGRLIAIRTPRWKLVSDREREELYVKPDDRWEQNDVHDRCRDVVEELRGQLPAR
jgi:arylsulfatase A-like enzyme